MNITIITKANPILKLGIYLILIFIPVFLFNYSWFNWIFILGLFTMVMLEDNEFIKNRKVGSLLISNNEIMSQTNGEIKKVVLTSQNRIYVYRESVFSNFLKVYFSYKFYLFENESALITNTLRISKKQETELNKYIESWRASNIMLENKNQINAT